MTPTLLTLLAALCPLVPLDHEDAPTSCRQCWHGALNHKVLQNRLVCPDTAGSIATTLTLEEHDDADTAARARRDPGLR